MGWIDFGLLMETSAGNNRFILHVCSREVLRPLRDQILRLAGFHVDSGLSHTDCLSMFEARRYDLVLIDVEGESGIYDAERLCSAIKTEKHDQFVAFVQTGKLVQEVADINFVSREVTANRVGVNRKSHLKSQYSLLTNTNTTIAESITTAITINPAGRRAGAAGPASSGWDAATEGAGTL